MCRMTKTWKNYQRKRLSNVYFCNHMCDYRSNRSVDIYTVTAWLSNQIQTVLANTQLPGNVSTDVCANFIVNKEQINRYLTIKLCDIFGVSYNYTWSGVGSEQDLSLIINEKNSINDSLIERVFDEIASPITHLEKNGSLLTQMKNCILLDITIMAAIKIPGITDCARLCRHQQYH